jgi:RNA polymerase sigma-70 factor (ECF subfamily)
MVGHERSREELFDELYRAHFEYVWKSARRLGVPLPEVDDVVQETFLTVHRLLDRYDPERAVRSWLFSVLWGLVLRHRRSHRRWAALAEQTTNVDGLPDSFASAPDRNVETHESARMLEAILDKLDPDKRAVLVLADIEEKPIAEIAQILGIKVNTAASRLRLAREHVDASLARLRARDGWRLK